MTQLGKPTYLLSRSELFHAHCDLLRSQAAVLLASSKHAVSHVCHGAVNMT